ncbi:MAG: hypothetical protein HUU16_20680 [Candidatus Omnitrophica bacterium]|nr:hypothetical protein [Candidatus Omnitrophota bacterium]
MRNLRSNFLVYTVLCLLPRAVALDSVCAKGLDPVAKDFDRADRGVALDGMHAYFSEGDALVVADISNPTEPVRMGSVGPGGIVRYIQIEGPRAYTGFNIYDISDPGHPALLGHYQYRLGTALRTVVRSPFVFFVDLSGNPFYNLEQPNLGYYQQLLPLSALDLDASGMKVYLLGTDKLEIHEIYVGDPPGEYYRSRLLGDHVFSEVRAWPYVRMRVAGNHVFVADYDNLQVLDVSDPESILSVGQVGLRGHTRDLDIEGSFAYVSQGSKGLEIIDISDPQSPTPRGYVDPVEEVRTLDVEGGTAILSSADAILIVDVSNPDMPELLTSITPEPVPTPTETPVTPEVFDRWPNGGDGAINANDLLQILSEDKGEQETLFMFAKFWQSN